MNQDFLLDDAGDLLIQGGDFAVGPSDVQHVEDIIESFAGMWKQHPFLGVGILQYLNSENPQGAIAAIKQQLQSDGYQLTSVAVKNTGDDLVISFPNGIIHNGDL